MTPDPSPEELYEILTDLSEKFDTKFNELARRINARLDKMATEIADMRVSMAKAEVLSVRLETVEREATRIEKRAASDAQTMIQYVTQVRDELGTFQIEHAQLHHAMERDHAKVHEAIIESMAHHSQIVKQLTGKWATVKGILVPLVVGILASVLTALLSGL